MTAWAQAGMGSRPHADTDAIHGLALPYDGRTKRIDWCGLEGDDMPANPPPGIGDARRVPSPWQPIETARKDGTRVLLFCPYGRTWIGVGAWEENLYHNGEKAWTTDDGESVVLAYDPPTHWMPLPEPPESP
jgi:Protein of unknown function (DUF551)